MQLLRILENSYIECEKCNLRKVSEQISKVRNVFSVLVLYSLDGLCSKRSPLRSLGEKVRQLQKVC